MHLTLASQSHPGGRHCVSAACFEGVAFCTGSHVDEYTRIHVLCLVHATVVTSWWLHACQIVCCKAMLHSAVMHPGSHFVNALSGALGGVPSTYQTFIHSSRACNTSMPCCNASIIDIDPAIVMLHPESMTCWPSCNGLHSRAPLNQPCCTDQVNSKWGQQHACSQLGS